MNEKYGQKEIHFVDFETLDQPRKKKLPILSKFNQKLEQGLNYNPKENE